MTPGDSPALICQIGNVSGVQADFADVSLERVGPELSGRKWRPGFSGVGRDEEIIYGGVVHHEFHLARRGLVDVELRPGFTFISVPPRAEERTLGVGDTKSESFWGIDVVWFSAKGAGADAFSYELVGQSSVACDVAEARNHLNRCTRVAPTLPSRVPVGSVQWPLETEADAVGKRYFSSTCLGRDRRDEQNDRRDGDHEYALHVSTPL